MSIKCSEFIEILEELAPLGLAEQWDNPGLLVGCRSAQIHKVLVALDVTDAVIQEAVEQKADLILTHHPLLFRAVKQITAEDRIGRKIFDLIQNNICHYAMHTNLDTAFGGTNDTLACLAGLMDVDILEASCEQNGMPNGIGRIGILEKSVPFGAFARSLKEKLGLSSMRIVGDQNRMVKTVGLCTGSGFSFMEAARKKGADVFITADLRYHECQNALDEGICLIDATHYGSECIIVPVLCEYIRKIAEEKAWSLEVAASSVNGQVFTDI